MQTVPRNHLLLAAVVTASTMAVVPVHVHAQATPPAQQPPTIQEIRDAEARYKERVGDLEKLTGVLSGAAILYSLAAAVASYFNLKRVRDEAQADATRSKGDLDTIKNNAQDDIARAKRDLDKMQQDIAAAIPIISDMNQSLNTLLVQLRGRIPNRWHETTEQISPQLLQQIKYDEITVAGLNLYLSDSQALLRPKLSELHQGLGRFYGALYRQGSPPDHELADKACFYFGKALSIYPDNYTAHRDRATLATIVAPNSPTTWADASVDYSACLKGIPGDARSLFGKSWCHFKKTEYAEAVRDLSILLDPANKHSTDDTQFVIPYAYLNRAIFLFKAHGKQPEPTDAAAPSVLNDCMAGLRCAEANRNLVPSVYADFCKELKDSLQKDLAGSFDTLPNELSAIVNMP